MKPWHRWQLFAVAPGPDMEFLAGEFNTHRDSFVFRRSAKRAARFYEQALGLPLRFYILPIARPSVTLED